VLCVAFFLLAFPSYFFLKAAATDDPAGMGGVGSYSVTADFTYLDFASGEEPIQDGTPFTLDLNTDSVDDAGGKNIVGVLVTMSYAENEEDGTTPIICAAPPQPAPDTISGMASHLNYSNSAEGQNQGGTGSHEVSTVWYNSSLIGDKVEGLSESEIIDQLDSKGAGMGDYVVEISVSSKSGSNLAGCQNSDSGETVSYTVQLIVLDFEITPYIEIEDI
jgi:hypothetical protein